MKQIKIYKLSPNDDSEQLGSIYNPYTWAQFMDLYEFGIWQGGYVEGRGYIPPYVRVAGNSIMIIDGISEWENYSYYPYTFFQAMDTTKHHTHLNDDGSETEVTDINVKASIDLYVMTIKINITKKGDCYINNYLVFLNIENCPKDYSQSLMNQSIDGNIFSHEITIDLPVNSLPSISLDFDCYYELNGNPGYDKKSVKIYPQD